MIPSTEWTERAACRGMDLAVFFPQDRAEAATAKSVCRRCHVQADCLNETLAISPAFDADGIFGGATPGERSDMRAKRRPEEHGTVAGYHRHRRRGEVACSPCLDAINAYGRSRGKAS